MKGLTPASKEWFSVAAVIWDSIVLLGVGYDGDSIKPNLKYRLKN